MFWSWTCEASHVHMSAYSCMENVQGETNVEADADARFLALIKWGFFSHTVIISTTGYTLRFSEDFWISMIICGCSFSMTHVIERWCGYCFSFRKAEIIALKSLEISHSLQIWNNQSKCDELSPVQYPQHFCQKKGLAVWENWCSSIFCCTSCKVDFAPFYQNTVKWSLLKKIFEMKGKKYAWDCFSDAGLVGVKHNCEEMKGLWLSIPSFFSILVLCYG